MIPPLPLWVYAVIGAGILLLFGVVQTHRLHATQKEYSAFVAQVKAQGDAAEKAAQERIKRDQQAKETTDAQIKRLTSDNNALSGRLRESRAAGGYVPPAAPGSADPNRACFDRAALELAIGRLDEGISGIAEKGDAARIGIEELRDWAKAR